LGLTFTIIQWALMVYSELQHEKVVLSKENEKNEIKVSFYDENMKDIQQLSSEVEELQSKIKQVFTALKIETEEQKTEKDESKLE